MGLLFPFGEDQIIVDLENQVAELEAAPATPANVEAIDELQALLSGLE